MEFITTLIHQIVELFAKLQAGGQEAAELFQAFLKFVGDILRFLEEHGLSKQIVDAVFNSSSRFSELLKENRNLSHHSVRQIFIAFNDALC